MKIAAIEYHPTSRKGGSEKAFFEVLKGLRNLGHQITVFYMLDGDYLAEYEKWGIQYQQLPPVSTQYFKLKNWRNLIQAVQIINKTQPDVIYINQLADSVIASACKLFSSVKIVCHLRVPKMGNSRLFNFTGKFVDGYIAVNHKIKNQYQHIFPKQSMTIINDGIEIPNNIPVLQAIGASTFKFKVAYLGRLSPEKGLLELIDCWDILNQSLSQKIELHLAGPAHSLKEQNYKRQIEKEIERRNLVELIFLHPAVSNPYTYFQDFDCSIFPSTIDEAFGRTIAESILAGIPVFARNVGITKEILVPQQELLFETERELVEKLKCFYEQRMIINMNTLKAHIIENYDIRQNVKLIESVLQNVLHKV